MNTKNKQSPGAGGILQPLNRQASHAPQPKPVVAQLKTDVSAQIGKRPVAPPVYRPQPTSKAAQPKITNGASNRKQPLAPPVYRPQPVPKVLQTKTTPAQSLTIGQALRQPVASPVRREPTPPPVYRPQPVPKVLQQKTNASRGGGPRTAIETGSRSAVTRKNDARSTSSRFQPRLGRATSLIQLAEQTTIESASPIRELFKGVGSMRLREDLKEPNLPVGIRPGSATALAMANGSRQPTELDKTTLWFGIKETAKDYCQKQRSSILLKIDVSGHPITECGSNYYTTEAVPWSKVKYLKKDGSWGSLAQNQEMPKDAKDLSGAEDSDSDEESW